MMQQLQQPVQRLSFGTRLFRILQKRQTELAELYIAAAAVVGGILLLLPHYTGFSLLEARWFFGITLVVLGMGQVVGVVYEMPRIRMSLMVALAGLWAVLSCALFLSYHFTRSLSLATGLVPLIALFSVLVSIQLATLLRINNEPM